MKLNYEEQICFKNHFHHGLLVSFTTVFPNQRMDWIFYVLWLLFLKVSVTAKGQIQSINQSIYLSINHVHKVMRQ